MKAKTIIVTGSRDFSDEEVIRDALTKIAKDAAENALLLHGDATGADEIASKVWKELGLPTKKFVAEWQVHDEDCYHRPSEYCPAAGPRRNQKMVDYGADIGLAFFSHIGSRGTRDCVKRMTGAGIPVLKYMSTQ